MTSLILYNELYVNKTIKMSTILEMQIDELQEELTAIKAINQKLQLEKNALKEQLILSGVINWVAIKDDLPTKDDDYLVCEDGFVFDAGYSKEYKGFHDHITTRYKDVTHWAELPKPPCL